MLFICQEFTADIFLRLRWDDPRLAYDMWNHSLTLDYNYASRIWLPDLFFYNEKKAEVHEVMVPNLYYRLWPKGRVMYSIRYDRMFACQFDSLPIPLLYNHTPLSYV